MKIKTKVLCLLLISTSVFAASDLVQEYNRRYELSRSSVNQDIMAFIEEAGRSPEAIQELEVINQAGEFAVRFNNDDVCFGNYQRLSLKCFDEAGLRTFFWQGDSD